MKRGKIAYCLLCIALASASAIAQDRGVAGTASVPGSDAECQGHKFGLIVGVNNYQDGGIGTLSYAVADARAVFEQLTRLPEGFEPDRLVLLCDDAVGDRQPTRNRIIHYLNAVTKMTQPQDTILVYFGGHGTALPGADGGPSALYLLPSDASLTDVAQTGIAFAYVQELLEHAPAQRKVVVLDACHSGAGRSINQLSADTAAQFERASRGMLVLASCGPDEVSHEMPEMGHGAFTYFLLDGLEGHADGNADGVLTASEVAAHVWDKTSTWALQKGFVQNPWRGGFQTGEFVLARLVPAASGQESADALRRTAEEARLAAENAEASLTDNVRKYASEEVAAGDAALAAARSAGEQYAAACEQYTLARAKYEDAMRLTPERMRAANPPQVEIRNVRVETANQNGQQGLEILSDVTLTGLEGEKVELAAYFEDQSGHALEDRDGQCRSSRGQVYSGKMLEIREDPEQETAFGLFLPYSQLDLVQAGKHTLAVRVHVWHVVPGKWQDLGSSEAMRFDVDVRPAQASAPAQRPRTLVFNSLIFHPNSFAMAPEGRVEIDKLVTLMREDSRVTVVVEGHASPDEEDPEGISQKRAEAVRQFIVQSGIDPGRVVAVGKGVREPGFDLSTHANRALNQRVVFNVTVAQ